MFRIQKLSKVILFPLAFAMLVSTPVAAQEDDRNIFEVLRQEDDLSIFEDVINAAKIRDSVAVTEDITVLAPTNEAFDNLPDEVKTNLLKEENLNQLLEVLRYHIILEPLDEEDLEDSQNLLTLLGAGQDVDIISEDNEVTINEKDIYDSIDESPTNGTLIKINEILLPEGFDIASLSKDIEETPRTGGADVSTSLFFVLPILLSAVVFGVKEVV